VLSDVFNLSGEKVGNVELSDYIFGIKPNMSVVHDYVVSYLANQRRGTKSALTRAEVSGGGIKPWRQKGTGHARQGSTRSPQWRHGGIVFAPKPRDYSQVLNKKVKRLAVRSIFSCKSLSKNLIILEDFAMDSYNTKTISKMLKCFDAKKSSLILAKSDEFILKSSSNIKELAVMSAESLNSYDIFRHEKLFIFSGALEKINEIFGSEPKKKVVA
jgi:large subunit ribosomal protein L4